MPTSCMGHCLFMLVPRNKISWKGISDKLFITHIDKYSVVFMHSVSCASHCDVSFHPRLFICVCVCVCVCMYVLVCVHLHVCACVCVKK